ncbi:MAG: DNA polymerase III subunit chi [Rhodobacteraceae bacterium]|nr:DNA polymerase III subunit chi [Paracoccaceae bacterium]
MGAVLFYHLTRRPLEAVLPPLLEKALAQGWRVCLRGTDAERLDWLDRKLWLGPEEQFLPHGLAGGPHDALQPVLLTTACGPAANGAACLMAIDGAEVSPGEARAMARTCILFDGADPEALGRARAQWRALTAAGIGAEYWSEESGRWERRDSR